MTETTSREARFIESLQALVRSGARAPLAALRRGAAHPPGWLAETHRYVAPFTAGLERRTEDIYYMVASLFALHPEPGGKGSFGRAMADVARAGSGAGDSLERRFLALLDADSEQLQHRLRQLVSLARAKGAPVDWARLLEDLRWWNRSDRGVQRRWAADFYRAIEPTGRDSGEGDKEGEVET